MVLACDYQSPTVAWCTHQYTTEIHRMQLEPDPLLTLYLTDGQSGKYDDAAAVAHHLVQ